MDTFVGKPLVRGSPGAAGVFGPVDPLRGTGKNDLRVSRVDGKGEDVGLLRYPLQKDPFLAAIDGLVGTMPVRPDIDRVAVGRRDRYGAAPQSVQRAAKRVPGLSTIARLKDAAAPGAGIESLASARVKCENSLLRCASLLACTEIHAGTQTEGFRQVSRFAIFFATKRIILAEKT